MSCMVEGGIEGEGEGGRKGRDGRGGMPKTYLGIVFWSQAILSGSFHGLEGITKRTKRGNFRIVSC